MNRTRGTINRPLASPVWGWFVLLLAVMPAEVWAQWQPNGVSLQAATGIGAPHLLLDGAGGVFVFADNSHRDYVFRVTSQGTAAPNWPTVGIPLTIGTTFQSKSADRCMNTDGTIGAVVLDSVDWCARFTADGQSVPGWPRIPVAGQYDLAQIFAAHDAGNLILSTAAPQFVYSGPFTSLRLGADGLPLAGTPPDGRVIVAQSPARDSSLYFSRAIPCPGGGVWVAFTNQNAFQNHPRFLSWITRINDDGSIDPSWGGGRFQFASSPADPQGMQLASDGAGGFFVAWVDDRTGLAVPFPQALNALDIYLTHITASGQIAPGWSASGFPVCTTPGEQDLEAIAADGSGGVFVLWGPSGGQGFDIHAQHILGNGTLAPGWPVNGKSMFGGNAYPLVSVAPNGLGGMFVSAASYDDLGISREIAQHVNGHGDFDTAWSPYGYVVDSTPLAGTVDSQIVPVGPGVAIMAWTRITGSKHQVCLQKLVVGGVVAAQAALVTSSASPERVSLTWSIGGDRVSEVVIERQLVEQAWESLATVAPDGTGQVRFDDRSVVPGTAYRYRLSWAAGAALGYSEPSLIQVPSAYRFALEGARPNPARGRDLSIAYSLAVPGAASLAVYDVGGRRIASRALDANGIGPQAVRLEDARPLGAGIYWVRLSQGSRSLTTRIVVLE